MGQYRSNDLCPHRYAPNGKRPVQDRKKHKSMPRKKRKLILTQPVREGLKTFKVRLDARTVITLASKKALDFWKEKYPNAVIIN